MHIRSQRPKSQAPSSEAAAGRLGTCPNLALYLLYSSLVSEQFHEHHFKQMQFQNHAFFNCMNQCRFRMSIIRAIAKGWTDGRLIRFRNVPLSQISLVAQMDVNRLAKTTRIICCSSSVTTWIRPCHNTSARDLMDVLTELVVLPCCTDVLPKPCLVANWPHQLDFYLRVSSK